MTLKCKAVSANQTFTQCALEKWVQGFLILLSCQISANVANAQAFILTAKAKKKGDESKDLSSLAIKRHQRDFGKPADMFCVAGKRHCSSKHLYTWWKLAISWKWTYSWKEVAARSCVHYLRLVFTTLYLTLQKLFMRLFCTILFIIIIMTIIIKTS